MFNLGFTSSSSASSLQSPSAYSDAYTQKGTSRKGRASRRGRRRRRNRKRDAVHVDPEDHAFAAHSNGNKPHDAPMTRSDLYFALDCEMVGIGPEGFDSAVARVTVINWENEVVLDAHVRVPVPVTDYRTHISGISPADLESENAKTFEEARDAVSEILNGKILIGHGLENDLCALGLTHPWSDVRDTACYGPLMRESVDPLTGSALWKPRKLRDLAWEKLGRQIQCYDRAHCPREDAVSALDLYKSVRNDWERDLIEQREAEERLRAPKSSSFWQLPLSGSMHSRMAAESTMPARGPFVPVSGGMVDMVPAPPPQSSQSSWFFFARRGRSKSPPPPVVEEASTTVLLEDDDATTLISSSFGSFETEPWFLPAGMENMTLIDDETSPIPE